MRRDCLDCGDSHVHTHVKTRTDTHPRHTWTGAHGHTHMAVQAVTWDPSPRVAEPGRVSAGDTRAGAVTGPRGRLRRSGKQGAETISRGRVCMWWPRPDLPLAVQRLLAAHVPDGVFRHTLGSPWNGAHGIRHLRGQCPRREGWDGEVGGAQPRTRDSSALLGVLLSPGRGGGALSALGSTVAALACVPLGPRRLLGSAWLHCGECGGNPVTGTLRGRDGTSQGSPRGSDRCSCFAHQGAPDGLLCCAHLSLQPVGAPLLPR